MKKIIVGIFVLSSIAAFADTTGVNVYTKVGADVYSRYHKLEIDGVSHHKKHKMSPTIALEVTKNVTNNLELGLGAAYTHGNGHSTLKADGKEGEMKRYDSVPLYAIAKYNFNLGSDVKPFVKADLGYSFNKHAKWNVKEFEHNSVTTDSGREKIKDGLYYALGTGVEYNNFITELDYVHTSAKLKNNDMFKSNKYDKGVVRLSVGYKFNF